MANKTVEMITKIQKSVVVKNDTDRVNVAKRIVSTWFATSDIFSECDTYINESVSLKGDNLVGEAIITSKRGGANRIRVYVNPTPESVNDIDVSVRYGFNMPYHKEALSIGQNTSKRVQVTAKDGKTESRIRMLSSRFNGFVVELEKLVNADADNAEKLVKAETAESVTA